MHIWKMRPLLCMSLLCMSLPNKHGGLRTRGYPLTHPRASGVASQFNDLSAASTCCYLVHTPPHRPILISLSSLSTRDTNGVHYNHMQPSLLRSHTPLGAWQEEEDAGTLLYLQLLSHDQKWRHLRREGFSSTAGPTSTYRFSRWFSGSTVLVDIRAPLLVSVMRGLPLGPPRSSQNCCFFPQYRHSSDLRAHRCATRWSFHRYKHCVDASPNSISTSWPILFWLSALSRPVAARLLWIQSVTPGLDHQTCSSLCPLLLFAGHRQKNSRPRLSALSPWSEKYRPHPLALVRKRTSRVNLLLPDGSLPAPSSPPQCPLHPVSLCKPPASTRRPLPSSRCLEPARQKKRGAQKALKEFTPKGLAVFKTPLVVLGSSPIKSLSSRSLLLLPASLLIIQLVSLLDDCNNLLELSVSFLQHTTGKLSAPLDTWPYPSLLPKFFFAIPSFWACQG